MKKYFIGIFLPPLICFNLYGSDESEVQELKEQVQMMLKRINELEKKVKAKNEITAELDGKKDIEVQKNKIKPKNKIYITDLSSDNDTPSKQKGFLELKTADTVLSVGGRIQLDTHYTWPEGTHYAKKIAIGGSAGENGHITFDARYSRLWVKTRTPSEYGPIRTLVETDFWGTASGTEANTNSNGPRLRHAYVQIGNWTVGQTNSAFNTHTTLDILYTAINDVFARQPLIRYSVEDEKFSYDISFEQPETTLLDPDGKIITPKDDVVPDVVGRIRYYPSWGELGFSLMGRYINQDRADITVSGASTTLYNRDSAFGWAANISGKVNVFHGDDIRFAAHYGNGLGRYIAYNAFTAGSIDANGNIKLQPTYGGNLGYRHWWNNKLRSTLSFSYAATKNNMEVVSSAADLAAINKATHSTQLNLIWTPVPNSLIGLEYAKAYHEVESGEQGDMDTAMLRFLYDF